ncbi:triose-phosphate isomerase [Celerinatantimonas diazotrophica]|uniref:Triosephosphate isomerase n=1 Tax=Celerinatantimonas diazotrophica TaxID=412034 RepID=A0A4R1JAQ3_9GAMM|nr:triose-phosphate isomerase [Celerinatantimonas diazotrophica]TCK47584.1 triosephosphate isomerase [Celerinatantimonas diazotrophica]CAG9296793.1 Triosephosphate isomerase [Celerinatantimonas diazotrophica]
MRTPLVMGNWKLNGDKASVEALVKGLIKPANDATGVEVAVCAPTVFLGMVEQLAAGSKLAYGSQDADVNTQGAFTGENSPVMLKEFGCKYSLVGHSERREYHNETDEVVASKFKAIQENGLLPVLCIGESLEQNEAGETQAVVERQLKAVIDLCGIEAFNNAVIAYEPIWAIGTGKSATAEQAQAVHAGIRQWLAAQNANVAEKVQILYGGSVKAATAKELFGQSDIDGGLVGGASLKVDEFSGIIAAAK